MKRFIVFIILSILVCSIAVAQTAIDTDAFKETIENLSNDIGPVLPFAAATTGNNWDDAYIGQLPHFGIGVSVGTVFIPSDSVDELFTLLEVERPQSMKDMEYIPLPSYTIDARLGGLIKPFDIGVKAGIYSQNADQEDNSSGSSDFLIDYAMLGFDIRYALVEQSLILPDISISAGLNYLKTNIRTKLDSASYANAIAIEGVTIGTPDLGFSMESTSVDFKAQISKSLLILRPFGGVGASYGKSTVSADLYSEITGADIVTLENAGFEVEDTKVYYESEYTGWTTRAFAGVGLQVFMLKVNAQLSYSPETEAIGASINGRIQF